MEKVFIREEISNEPQATEEEIREDNELDFDVDLEKLDLTYAAGEPRIY